jgi:cytoskeleton protein RodZ
MKQKTAPEDNTPSQNTVDSPGSQLRKARERKGLDQAKVAGQLNLSKSIVQSLESDDNEHLPAAVFVQGYLRKYARLVGLDEDAIIQAYQELQPDIAQPPLQKSQPDNVAKELHSDNGLMRYITWFVLAALAMLIFFWWQGRVDVTEPPQQSEESRESIEPAFEPPQQDESQLPQEEALPSIPEPDLPADFQAPSDLPPSDLPEVSPAPADEEAPIQPVVTEPVATEPVATEPVATEPVATEPVATEPEQTETLAPVDEMPTTPISDSPAEIQPVQEADTESPIAADGLVVFEFSGPCWVEVSDASGRMRIIGVMREGMRRSLDSQLGPFSVVIGDIQAARLSVNGEDYDMSRHTRGKVARFTLDPSRL